MHLGFVVRCPVTRPAIDHQQAICGVHFHGSRENVLHLALKRSLARISRGNPVYQWRTCKMQRIVGKPGVERRKRRGIGESLAIEVLSEDSAPSGEEVKII